MRDSTDGTVYKSYIHFSRSVLHICNRSCGRLKLNMHIVNNYLLIQKILFTGHRKNHFLFCVFLFFFFIFVNVVFACTYIVFHTSFALLGCKYWALSPPRVWLTEQSTHFVVLFSFFFFSGKKTRKHLNLMQIYNSLHLHTREKCATLQRLGDSGPVSMLYCCIIFWTVMFSVSRTTWNALDDKHLAGLMLRLFLVPRCFCTCAVYEHVRCESLDSSTVIPPCTPPSLESKASRI